MYRVISEEETKTIESLQEKGHTLHCACRIVWGDGWCSCWKELRDKEVEESVKSI